MDRLIADEVVFLPVLEPVRDLLSKERKETLLAADIDAMNSDLSARLSPSSYFYTSPPLAAAPPLTTASLTSPASPSTPFSNLLRRPTAFTSPHGHSPSRLSSCGTCVVTTSCQRRSPWTRRAAKGIRWSEECRRS
jgi:hypothetical protein